MIRRKPGLLAVLLVAVLVLSACEIGYYQPWTRTLVPPRGPDPTQDVPELLYQACSQTIGSAPDGGIIESPGTLHPIGLLGDSISSQTQLAVRQTSVYPGDPDVHWIGGARCGDTFTGQKQLQMNGVLAENPEVLVVALGTNAESNANRQFADDPQWSQTVGPAQALLDATASVPCRVLVTVAYTAHGFTDQPTVAKWAAYNQSVNAFLVNYAATHPRTYVYDFAAEVTAKPNLLFDQVHLTHDGINVRTNGMLAAAQQCYLPGVVLGTNAVGGHNGSVSVWWSPMPGPYRVTQYDVASDTGQITSVTIPPNGGTAPPATVNVPAVNGESHTYRVRARNANGISEWSAWSTPVTANNTGSRFHAVTPKRLVDTRDGTGIGRSTPLAPGETLRVNLTTLTGSGLPTSAANMSAVALNVTAANATQQTFLTVWPGDRSQPPTSSLNPGPTRPQHPASVTTEVGADGTIAIFNNSGTVHVAIDVAGYYGKDASGARYQALAPARVFNTTDGNGMPGGIANKITANATLTFVMAGRGGVPATGATSVVLNVTSANASADSFLTLWPSLIAKPLTSQLNPKPGLVKPNLVMVPIGSDGKISVFNNSGESDVIVDVLGYFGPNGAATGLFYYPITPERQMDTRPNFFANRTVNPVGGIYPPAGTIKALDLNVTVIGGPGAGHVTVLPVSGAMTTSNLNFSPGEVTSNAVVTKTSGFANTAWLATNTTAAFIVDVSGWFA